MSGAERCRLGQRGGGGGDSGAQRTGIHLRRPTPHRAEVAVAIARRDAWQKANIPSTSLATSPTVSAASVSLSSRVHGVVSAISASDKIASPETFSRPGRPPPAGREG